MEPVQQPNQPPVPERSNTESSPKTERPAMPETAPVTPTGPTAPAQAPANLPAAPAQPAPATATPGVAPAQTPATNPTTADDVDVIEKEWVDQANKIVEQTKDDPYTEEEAVEALQIDYLKKRYNHDVKKPDDK